MQVDNDGASPIMQDVGLNASRPCIFAPLVNDFSSVVVRQRCA
jgi:hypothetical protein